ncbi:MAG: hypoxanthine phosphoribosyltransferase [Ignavibacteriaceae bacterium]|jgi:hypoxanthine phosphoribosyltransferase|nr:hypoxanthine phosphoribosyltransferase [Ignavibacteriaceae bacterium]
MDNLIIGNDVFVPLLTEEQIQNRIKELAEQISEDYADKIPIFIGVLNGAFIFLSDLMKSITINCEIDFFKLSSYGDAKLSSGNVRLLKELNCDVNGRDIIIVEDIVDSGLSIKFIGELFSSYSPGSIKVCTLLLKPQSLKYDVKIDYIGFQIPGKFVIGYGLDYAQKYRNLKSIYALSENSEKNI